jgi:lipoate---protein ligase
LWCLNIPVEKLQGKEIQSLKERVTWIKREIGRTPPMADIKAAVSAGWKKTFGIPLQPGGLTNEEDRLFKKKQAKYRSEDWIDLIRPKSPSKEVFQALNRTPAGLVRFTLETDPARRRIRSIYITGDFFSFPSRALFDLESELKGKRLERTALHRLVEEYFDQGRLHIQDMTCREFLVPLERILKDIEAG